MKQVADSLRHAWRLAEPWSLVTFSALAATCIILGVFEAANAGWAAAVIATMTCAAALFDGQRRFKDGPRTGPLVVYEGPLLWVSSAWLLMRWSGHFSGEMLVVSAALLAWIHVALPKNVSHACFGYAAVLELGLVLTGYQTILAGLVHGAVIGLVVQGLSRFAASEAFRVRLDEARERHEKEANDRERARGFGLLTAQAPMLGGLPELREARPTVGRVTLDFLDQSFAIQMEVLRDALGLNTAAVLWLDDAGLYLRGVSTHRTDILPGPFPAGLGIPGSVLQSGNEVSLSQVHKQFGGIPYYERVGGVGSVLAMAITKTTDQSPMGVLVVDRAKAGEWSAEERSVFRLVTRKIALDVTTGQSLKASDHERSTVRRFCAALGELNGALGLDQVATATVDAIGAMVQADLTIIAVTNEDRLRVVVAHGENAEKYSNLQLGSEDSLVRQSIKLSHTLPVIGQSRRRGAVLSSQDRLEHMQSLLVVPLILPEGQAIGALVVASREANVFEPSSREMLELIAGQVAIKLDLARAHEQIREMATTDPLTSLQNRRTFNLAFDNMLERANRRTDPLCVLMVDIDKFKPLNDTYGHPFGDEVLKGVAKVLQNAVRSVDVAARIGGEEFALVLENSSVEAGHQIGERIRQDVEDLVFMHPEKGTVKITLSMGLSMFPRDGEDKETLRSRADDALYLAKNSGRNQVRAWPEVEAAHVHEFSQAEGALH